MKESEIRLRAPEPADLDFLYWLESEPQVWRISWSEAPLSRHMIWEYLQSYSADIYRDRQLRFIIEDGVCQVGTADISDFDPRNSRAMLGIAVKPEKQHQGMATQALMQVIEYCRQVLNLHQVAAMVPKDNEASLRLFKNLGFSSSGCLQSWLRRGNRFTDVIILQLML